ncbi:MAG: class I SAM-dependent methyltransferase [Myxococcota bacterium]|nr:class I SAM-dependent methyltransferase [Myxococcota bacterium]
MHPIQSEADLDRMRRTMMAYMTISAWSSAGFFEPFKDGRMRPLDVLEGDPRALHVGATILGHVGLLQTDGRRWGMSPRGLELLHEGIFDHISHNDTCSYLLGLPDVFRNGTAIQDTDIGVVESDPERVRRFMHALYRRSEKPAAHAAAWMAEWLPKGSRVLDLGGGHGRYAAAMAEHGLEATLFDKAICTAIAREICGDAIQTLDGDFHSDNLGGPYDAVFVSNIVHGLGEEANRALLDRLVEVLAPNGRVVVKDFFAQGGGMHPEGAVMFGLVMLMYTTQGRTYTIGEMQDMLTVSGLIPEEVVEAPQLGYELVVGRKPA